MIPKTIHCWLSDEPIPAIIQKVDGMKSDAEYRIKKWDAKGFYIYSVKWKIEDAYNKRNGRFETDYIRAYALSPKGILSDSDVIANANLIHFELWFCIHLWSIITLTKS